LAKFEKEAVRRHKEFAVHYPDEKRVGQYPPSLVIVLQARYWMQHPLLHSSDSQNYSELVKQQAELLKELG
jgi:hypothetical protein